MAGMWEVRECETCKRKREVAVACYSYGAISFAYCMECLQHNAHPHWALEGTVLECGGWDKVRDEFGDSNYYFDTKDGQYHQAKEIVVTKERVNEFWKGYEEASRKADERGGQDEVCL